MAAGLFEQIFPDPLRRRLAEVTTLSPCGVLHSLDGADEVLSRTEVLLTGWGCPPIGPAVVDRAPRLRAIVHTGGSVKRFLDERVFDRGIVVSSAAAANAVPVAEFTLAAIIFGVKRVFAWAAHYRTGRTPVPAHWLGANGITVGVIGASRVGRKVIGLLRNLDVRILVYDPYADPGDLRAMGAVPVPLDSLLRQSQVVTIHAPATPETRGLLDRRRLGFLPDGALVINTARGSLIDTDALTDELVSGRLDAVLDVTEPEPLPPDSPLRDLPNVLLTPHLAGAQGNELPRLGELAVAELARLHEGLPFAHEVRKEDLPRLA